MRLLILLLFLSNHWLLAQQIPRGAEGITLKTNLPDSVIFKKTASFLISKDYVLDKEDTSRGIIVTDHKSSSGLLSMRILATVKEGNATFKGQWSAQAMGYSFTNEPVRFKGMVGSNEKKSFQKLNDLIVSFARTIEGSTIDYIPPTQK